MFFKALQDSDQQVLVVNATTEADGLICEVLQVRSLFSGEVELIEIQGEQSIRVVIPEDYSQSAVGTVVNYNRLPRILLPYPDKDS